MSRVAVVDALTNTVTAVIVAEATDTPYAGTFFVDVDHMACGIGWLYDPVVNDFVNSDPPAEEDPPLEEGGG